MSVTPIARIHLLLLTVDPIEEPIERFDGFRDEAESDEELV